MKSSGLRIAVLGGGVSSAVGRAHLAAISLTNSFNLECALFSRDPKLNLLSAKLWNLGESGVCQTEAEFNGRVGEVDIAIILTPTPQHFEQVTNLCGRVETIVCEKTVASSFAEGKKLAVSTSSTGTKIFPIFNYSCFPQVRHLRDLVEVGFLGELISVAGRMPQQSFLMREPDASPGKVQEWRLKDGPISGVSLDLGSHLLHLVEFVTQRASERIVAQGGHFGIQGEVVDLVQALMQLQGGVRAIVEYGKVHLGHENGLSIEVFGSMRSARWVQSQPDVLTISDNQGVTTVHSKSVPQYRQSQWSAFDSFKPGHPSGYVEALSNYYFDVAGAINTTRGNPSSFTGSLLPSLDDANLNLHHLELIEKSMQSGTWRSSGASRK